MPALLHKRFSFPLVTITLFLVLSFVLNTVICHPLEEQRYDTGPSSSLDDFVEIEDAEDLSTSFYSSLEDYDTRPSDDHFSVLTKRKEDNPISALPGGFLTPSEVHKPPAKAKPPPPSTGKTAQTASKSSEKSETPKKSSKSKKKIPKAPKSQAQTKSSTKKKSGKLVKIWGVDHCGRNSVADYKALMAGKKKGVPIKVKKVIMRGYQEANGGSIDPVFVSNYKNAAKAGVPYIETYWFPCVKGGCKSIEKQAASLVSTIKKHNMKIERIWLDPERSGKNWPYGHKGNAKIAKRMVKAIQKAGFETGFYSSKGDYDSIFGGQKIGPNLPLWKASWGTSPTKTIGAAQSSGKGSSLYGGWKTTSVRGHQYKGNLHGGYDLNLFLQEI